ncbi:MAG: (Fe-S)-binding protein [Candidatus Hodarchaeota archaeon]
MAKTGMERLEELKKDIYKCIHCKACRFAYSGEPDRKGIGEHTGKQGTVLYEGMVDACPAGIEYGWEAFWNAGKIWIARSILNGDLEFSEEVRDVIMPCITCGQCSAQCENKVRTVEIIESLRAACVESGIPMIEKHQLVRRLTEEKNNPYGGAADERFKWAKDAGLEKYIDNKAAKVGYFVGCTASYRQIEIAIATCKIFEQLGIDFTLISDEVCCGSPFFRVGAVDIAQDLMNKNVEAFKGLKMVFFSCAGCYKTFTNDYPKWMSEGKIPFKTMHAFELVARLITAAKIKFKPNKQLKGKTVTYHDPCHLGRHMALEIEQSIIEESENLMMDNRKIRQQIEAWYEVPRIILKQLEQDVGIVFKEMYRIKLDSFCCGAGGGVRAGFPDFSLRTSSLRLDEANAIKADIVTTECPFCYRNLYDANELYNHGVQVYGLIQLIDNFKLLEISEKPTFDEILKMKN